MKLKLKHFPNGATVVFEGKLYTKRPSSMSFHFALVSPECKIYLHRDTYVEPVIIEEQLNNE